MPSLIDDLMHRKGTLALTGLHVARSGPFEWVRLPEESEHDFLTRAQRAAKAEGYRIATFTGAVHTDDRISFAVTKGGKTNGQAYNEDAEAGD